MRRRAFKVGISAILDPRVTPHARTFLRAIALARNFLPSLGEIEFLYRDDAASASTAEIVARGFVKAGVDVVIGHFSSDAALAATPIYEEAKLPVLLPASTVDAATKRSGVYRLCPTDSALAKFLVKAVLAEGWDSIEVLSDESVHGRAIADAVRQEAKANKVEIDTSRSVCATVFAGRLAESEAYLPLHFTARPNTPLILSDDAVSPRMLGRKALPAPVYAIGFPPPWCFPRASLISRRHELLFGNLPETYFLESYAAFEMLSALIANDVSMRLTDFLEQNSFQTVLGPIKFALGNAENLGHVVWVLEESGFAVSNNPSRIPWTAEGAGQGDARGLR